MTAHNNFFDLGYSKYKLSMGLHKIDNTNLFLTKPNVLTKIRYHSKKSKFAAYIIRI